MVFGCPASWRSAWKLRRGPFMDGEWVTFRNSNKAVFTVRPVWVTNGCRSAAAAATAAAATLFYESYMMVNVVQNPQESNVYEYEKKHARCVGVYSGRMYGCVRYVLRVARVDSGCTVFSFSKIKPKIAYCCIRTCSIVLSASSPLSAFLLLLLLLLLLPSVRIQNSLFCFPFDEIYRRLLFFILGRYVSAWIDYSTTKWNRQT